MTTREGLTINTRTHARRRRDATNVARAHRAAEHTARALSERGEVGHGVERLDGPRGGGGGGQRHGSGGRGRRGGGGHRLLFYAQPRQRRERRERRGRAGDDDAARGHEAIVQEERGAAGGRAARVNTRTGRARPPTRERWRAHLELLHFLPLREFDMQVRTWGGYCGALKSSTARAHEAR